MQNESHLDEAINSAGQHKLPRYNHYVPKFILKSFAHNGKICIFDKHTLKEFKLPPDRAMGENDFTNVRTIDGQALSFENKFSHVENLAAPVIRKITNTKSLLSLDAMETATLHVFVLIQYLRSKKRLLDHNILTEEIKRRWPDAPINPWSDKITDQELAKFLTLDVATSNLSRFAPHFVSKHSYLMIRDCKDEIYVSDNPFVMHNQKTFWPRGNIGIGVPYIELYYPLSPDLILAYACPLVLKEIEAAHAKAEKHLASFITRRVLSTGISERDIFDFQRDQSEMKRAKDYYAMMKNERAVPMDSQNVAFLNSLQVASSYRYLGARKAAFQFARKALNERPHWREGLKIEVA